MASSPENGNSGDAHDSAAPSASGHEASTVPDNTSVPKPKRLACMICRKRKLKCDGIRPSCSTCARLGHACAYDEQRRKSGPKRGYVKALEERLKQVETLLKTQDPLPSSTSPTKSVLPGAHSRLSSLAVADHEVGGGWRQFSADSPQPSGLDDFNFNAGLSLPLAGSNPNGNNGNKGNNSNNNNSKSNANNDGSNVDGSFSWEMIGLGLEEPLPPQDTIDELHDVYFDKVHPSVPMIHRYRYLAAMNLAPGQRPPVCLRYAMWTLACSITDKFLDLKDLFYQRARKYVEADYIKGYGEHMISVAHCQTHILLACYEMKMMYFPRAWINTGSAVRLAQMIGLHRLDGSGLDVKQCLPPPKDWTEREERRRTFWMAFCEDRYASIGTGWPMTIDEHDITTRLPASEDAFELSRPQQTHTLAESTAPGGAAKLSSFAGVVLLSSLFGRNLVHLHRPDDQDELDRDLNGPFWKRHRQMDSILLNTSLSLPCHLKLPAGLSNPNTVFTNMAIHTSTICLHQAAIFKAEKHKLAGSVSSESKVRCITAALEIAGIMRTISHMDLSTMNPFISFCLYVGARVFVQYLKSRPDDAQATDSLRFLLSAMDALKRRNPLTESFLVQLDVDLEALATQIPKLRDSLQRPGRSPDIASASRFAKTDQVCDVSEGPLADYRANCLMSKMSASGGHQAAMAGDMAEAQVDSFGQAWLSAEQQAAGASHDKSASLQDARPSPDAGQSNGPTPNSSGTASNGRAAAHLAAGPLGGASFAASPMASHQRMLHHQHPGDAMDTSDHTSFFGDMNAFPISSGVDGGLEGQPTGTAPGFAMSPGAWTGINSQHSANMQPVGEGVLRALMNMGPMDAMDLSSWDPGNDAHMRG
ncbi:hypothetical protein CDD81_2599 [Ophiocordyceps australis]|uniref:Zn(2)-C6 fungal-type domain-containing protein n=1 Tax=Ophiocordyceps australis TaxID=1399860 RepID=A0A2C5XYS0_9HYPO|nr:hypothetical protein CDD81_2599 [Ophiocordyceps australis]